VAARNVIVIGCSVGGVEALQELVVRLHKDFPAALFVVLPSILTRAGSFPAVSGAQS
jgi:chemotaxis response regulator CheB